MARILIYVIAEEIFDDELYVSAEPVTSSTGIENDRSEFEGRLFALNGGGIKAVGECKVQLTLFEGFGTRWKVPIDVLPPPPYFLTDDDSLVIGFDRNVRINPSELLQWRLGKSNWQANAVSASNRPAIICPIKGKRLGENRLIVLGKESLPDVVELRDLDDPDELLGLAYIAES